MLIAAEFQAALPEPHAILGLRLLPLSLGRYKLLKRFGSPFVDDEVKEIGVEQLTRELFFALLVCGLEVEEFENLFNHPQKLAKEARRFGKKAGKIIKRTKNFSILEPINSFRKYLTEGSSAPWVVLSSNNNSETSIAHWSTSIEVVLRYKIRWTDEKINEDPLTEALTHFFRYCELEGMVKLYDHEVWQGLQAEAKSNGEALAKIMESYGT